MNHLIADQLFDVLRREFTDAELYELASDLQLDFDAIVGPGNRRVMMLELIVWAQEHGRLSDLLVAAASRKPAEEGLGVLGLTFTDAIAMANACGDSRQLQWIERGLRASRSVCRVLSPNGLGTGFLVGPRTLLTSRHIINSVDVARNSILEFGHQLTADGMPSAPVRYTLDPGFLFKSGAVGGLDYALVAVTAKNFEAPPASVWGRLDLNRSLEVWSGQHVSMIQHSGAGPKVLSFMATRVQKSASPHFYFTMETPGSSGSPIFNDSWEVVAIQTLSGPPEKEPMGGIRYLNLGVLVSYILHDLGEVPPQYLVASAHGRGDIEAEWTDDKTNRRFELIDKALQQSISLSEEFELDQLNEELCAHIDTEENVPLEGARRLHAELVRRKTNAKE